MGTLAPTTLWEKPVKIGVEVASPRQQLRKILSLIDDHRRGSAPAKAGNIDGRVHATNKVCLVGR